MVNIWMPLFPKLFNQQTIQHHDFSFPKMESRSRTNLEGKATQAKIGILIPFPMTMMTLNTASMIRSIRILRSTLETLLRMNSCKNNLKKYFLPWQTFFSNSKPLTKKTFWMKLKPIKSISMTWTTKYLVWGKNWDKPFSLTKINNNVLIPLF